MLLAPQQLYSHRILIDMNFLKYNITYHIELNMLTIRIMQSMYRDVAHAVPVFDSVSATLGELEFSIEISR